MNNKHINDVKNKNLYLLSSGLFSDFSIKINENVFPCHRCILYTGSEFFKGFLNFNSNSKELNLSEEIVSANGIKNCLEFIYKLGCDSIVTDEECEETYVAADYLQISSLKSVASEKISGNINCQNSFGIMHFSIVYNDKPLQLKAQHFINNNFNKLCFDNKDYLSLQFDLVSEIVSDRNLSSSDALIMKALLKWTAFDVMNRRQLLEENVGNLIQLHLISNEHWNNLAKEENCSNIIECIRKKSQPLNYYNDKPHRIGTPIVLYCIGSHRSDRIDSNSNHFFVDKSEGQLPSMMEERLHHKVCSSSTFIFVIAGESPDGYLFKSCERYNLVERTWNSMAELDLHRSNFAVACLEGFVYLIGGRIIIDSNCNVSKDIMIYDSGSNIWNKSAFQTHCDMIDSVAVGHCRLIYVAGGVNDSNRPTNRIMEFDPATGDWTKINCSGLPEEIFSFPNISTISLTAGGSTSDNDGFLLFCGMLNGCYMVYVYHFSLNRWRLSTRLEDLHNAPELNTQRVNIYCEREFIGILSTTTISILEHLRLPIPNLDNILDDLFIFYKFQISNDWSGEIDLVNNSLIKSFSAKSGFQFVLAALLVD